MNPVIQGLDGVEVRWEATDGGLLPELIGYNADSLAHLGTDAVRQLIDTLSDERLFVAAHVLLTKLSGIAYQTFPSWNGLAVHIAADGTVSIDPAQRFDLIRRWERWYSSEHR